MQSDNNNRLDPKTTTTTASASILGENNNDTNNNDHQQVMQLSNTADTQESTTTDILINNENTTTTSTYLPKDDNNNDNDNSDNQEGMQLSNTADTQQSTITDTLINGTNTTITTTTIKPTITVHHSNVESMDVSTDSPAPNDNIIGGSVNIDNNHANSEKVTEKTVANGDDNNNDNTSVESSPQPIIDPESERKRHLNEILEHVDGESGSDNDDDDDEIMTEAERDGDQEQANNVMVEGLCIDCKDQEASLYCENCSEDFCEMCYAMLHRTGNRRNHKTKNLKHLNNNGPENNLQQQSHQNGKRKSDAMDSANGNGARSLSEIANLSDDKDGGLKATSTIISSGGSTFGQWLEERSKYIPIRLTLSERKFLRLLEAALNVSEYTDKIDIISYNSSKSRRILHQIKDLCAILSGLMVASDFKKGQELFANKSFEDNEEFFQKIFEIGRRHKVMNPEKMRDAYGKLMYLLMDSVIPEVQEMLSFSLISPIKTVFSFLKDRDALKVLHHDLVVDATKEIIPDGKTRYTINSEIKKKERAIEFLSAKFSNKNISSDEIKQCLYSIGDNHSYLRSNRDCCDRMLHYLTTYFHPEKIASGFSLAIQSGRHGARLSHNHETQYCYAKQTLSLWSEIQYEMFKLWTLADRDLLSENNTYRLRDTGQGLNRLQSCPSVSRTMHSILHLAQQKSGYWVGSSVIHLGDKNVPNALMFIDKYNQISRILTPILICLDSISTLVQKNTGIRAYIQNSFSDVENCKKTILADFFRYAFDGSGADNFFDAGSCIDGRLTSAWNWCSQIEKKTYFPVFLLTGFVGFDGENF